MSRTPWRTDKWFVSPWNFAPGVTADFRFRVKNESIKRKGPLSDAEVARIVERVVAPR